VASLEKACTELEAVLAIIAPIPARLDELAGGDHGGMADNGDQIPLAARLHTQHGKAVFLVVERDALNEPSEDLGSALSRLRFHRELLSTGDPTPSAGTRRCILFPVVMPETDGVRSYPRRLQIKGSLPFGAGARPLALMFPLVCLPDQENEIELRLS
jgi:hypothetical protein